MDVFVQILLLAILETVAIFSYAAVKAGCRLWEIAPFFFDFMGQHPRAMFALILPLMWFNWIGLGIWGITFGWWFK